MAANIEKIKQLEGRLIEFKNNQKLAFDSGERKKAHEMIPKINKLELEIQDMKRNLTADNIFDLINPKIKANSDRIEKCETYSATLENRVKELEEIIDKLIHPEKYIEVKKPDKEVKPEEPLMTCPKCGRGGFKGKSGLTAHQRWCKMGK